MAKNKSNAKGKAKPKGKGKSKAMTKSAIVQHLAESTGLAKKQVVQIFDKMTELVKGQLGPKGPGMFTIPGLLKLKTVHKPATPERSGTHPFTKQPTTFKAKPERYIVRARALKALNDQIK